MNQKRKSGLQRGLAEIVETQIAPVEDKSQLSRGLIGKFAENKEAVLSQATQSTHSTEGSQPIAPARDYMKVANSINRTAMRQGLFKGKSKQIYDYLYSRTRGAIVPVRSVQASRKEIMSGAAIGSDKTIRENLRHLSSVGLVEWSEQVGAHGGNTYTVYLPEETTATQSTQATQSTAGQNLPRVPRVESTQRTHGLSVDSVVTSTDPKTSFKTDEKNDDDEAAPARLRALERELTGKNSGSAAQWDELFDVLGAEMRIAAGRTTISSVPAFMAEHLRRRLWKMDKKQAAREGKELPDQPKPPTAGIPQGQMCPDCNNSGWWYPDGPEKGVAKCKHARLQEEGRPT